MPITLVSSDLRFKVSERRENHYGHKPTTLFLICLLSLFGRREKGKWRERERERKEGNRHPLAYRQRQQPPALIHSSWETSWIRSAGTHTKDVRGSHHHLLHLLVIASIRQMSTRCFRVRD